MKSGRFLKMRDVEILKSYHSLQRSRDPACHAQLKDFAGKSAQAAYGERPDLTCRSPAKVEFELKSSRFAGRDLANHGPADFPLFSLRPFRRRCA